MFWLKTNLKTAAFIYISNSFLGPVINFTKLKSTSSSFWGRKNPF